MANRNLVVIGASAGGIAALRDVLGGLPADFPAAIVVVMHVSPLAVSHLPEILTRAGPLPARHAVSGETITASTVYVAPPDRHVLVRPGWLEVSRGPRENRFRPAIDPLFRSAARAYGPAVIGVILSGALYDGASGLLAIEGRGGTAIVQDPQDATTTGMPLSALRVVEADYVLAAASIPEVLIALTQRHEELLQVPTEAIMAAEDRINRTIEADFAEQANNGRDGETTVFTCPDCGGVLWQDGTSQHLWFRCHVGHGFAPEVLLGQKSEELEAALWTSMRLLRERATLSHQLASNMVAANTTGDALARLDEQRSLNERYVQLIRELIEQLPSPADPLATNGTAQEDPGRPLLRQ